MRLSRPQLAFAISATLLYGSLVVFGQALHFLPGLNHFIAADSQCCCHHHCATGFERGQKEDTGEAASGVSEDCPLCGFLAMSQERLTSTPILFCDRYVLQPVYTGPLQHDSKPFWIYSARGPPA